jgi:hypothetical protein
MVLNAMNSSHLNIMAIVADNHKEQKIKPLKPSSKKLEHLGRLLPLPAAKTTGEKKPTKKPAF